MMEIGRNINQGICFFPLRLLDIEQTPLLESGRDGMGRLLSHLLRPSQVPPMGSSCLEDCAERGS